MSEFFRVEGMEASYGKISAVRGIDLHMEKGAVVTVVGPNGAGKTTMLNALMGLHPASGEIIFNGERIDKLSPEARLERGMCLVSERRELFTTMSVEDNLLLGAFVRRREPTNELRRSLDDVFDRFPRLRERRRQLAGTLSGGERQMLAIGRALMSRPSLLMLDEPSLGLAPRIVADMFRIVLDLKEIGTSILLVEQNARAALAVSDRGYVLEIGEVVIQGISSDLARDPRVVETYLGASIRQTDGSSSAATPPMNNATYGHAHEHPAFRHSHSNEGMQ